MTNQSIYFNHLQFLHRSRLHPRSVRHRGSLQSIYHRGVVLQMNPALVSPAEAKTPFPDPTLLPLVRRQLDSEGALFYDGSGCD